MVPSKWDGVYEKCYGCIDKSEEGDPLFGKIRHVLVSHSTVTLMCELWYSIGFE
ncbi:hypothetical protein HOLleu_43880 [Holothuria leucospilota]|uniref:Uncharacterized protein n=1 Tax=Holothuria leucospilota TaxID=206669 RepID=A0A9Q0YAL1_HOLLE|nr:hypothetical protein HOLleu_44679 [Holothuria leucospilota]KAJ8017745.1 hypothetical protein HOLleu_44627 [Holothuria leucospilota]KAJ8018233.1 hypothetical protein HOLleu_43880 [Holothuria leucospilota]